MKRDLQIAAVLALLLFGIYLLSFSGLFYSQDSMLMFSVAESFVKRGEFSADQMWTVYKARHELGLDGEAYSKTGYGAPLFAVPLYALALILPGNLGLTQTTMLTSSIVIALTAAMMFLSARQLQFSRGVSGATALLFGLATPAWVYAKQYWSEPYALFTLFATFYFLQRFRAEPRGRDALIAGVMLGLAITIRYPNAALVPFFAWYGFELQNILRAPRSNQQMRGLAWFVFALAFFALTIAYYNWARYGNPLTTGYRADETFDNPLLFGIYALLFSPGKGLFVYVPFLAALPVALALFIPRAKRESILFGVIFAFYLFLFSIWSGWHGGTNWSPRYLVPILPFVTLMIAPAIELAKTRRGFAIVFTMLAALSVAIQLIGVTVPALAYRSRMLKLSSNPDWDAIFQPALSPIIGSLNLLRPTVFDFAWLRVIDGVMQIDWLVIGTTIAFIALCAATLRQPSTKIILALIVLAIGLSWFSLYRYRDDPRNGGNDGYRAFLNIVVQNEKPGDVMILHNDIHQKFFFNENRARMRWYGLSRDPQQWDESTRALLTRLSQQFTRVWLVVDDATANMPDPVGEWLAQSLHVIAEQELGDGVSFVLYETGTGR
jgi:hypothetical protein